MTPGRRQFNTAMMLALGASLLPRPSSAVAPVSESRDWIGKMHAGLAEIDAASGGRLGVAVQDTGSGATASLRGDERFPMCSTFKYLAAAAVLERVEQHKENLERSIVFKPGDVVPNSPATQDRHGGAGMRLGDLCAAAVALSDNTAANLMLKSLGGPAGLTRFVRSLGDRVTRLDRVEPALNQAIPGDPRDTTTPLAMLGNLRTLLLGDALAPASRTQLLAWMKATTTSARRLRAHLPADWQVGDKTGAGARGTNNDVGILLPPRRAPLLVSVYLTGTRASLEQSSQVIAAVGALIVRHT